MTPPKVHRLLHWEGLQSGDVQRALKRDASGVPRTGLNPSDPQLLARLAGDAGLDASEAAAVLRDGRYAEEVRTAESERQRAGIRSVPGVVITRQHLRQGGQPPEVFEHALRQVADRVVNEACEATPGQQKPFVQLRCCASMSRSRASLRR